MPRLLDVDHPILTLSSLDQLNAINNSDKCEALRIQDKSARPTLGKGYLPEANLHLSILLQPTVVTSHIEPAEVDVPPTRSSSPRIRLGFFASAAWMTSTSSLPVELLSQIIRHIVPAAVHQMHPYRYPSDLLDLLDLCRLSAVSHQFQILAQHHLYSHIYIKPNAMALLISSKALSRYTVKELVIDWANQPRPSSAKECEEPARNPSRRENLAQSRWKGGTRSAYLVK
ncbi:hypothetical protein P7C70_g2478, partial [Phenoliferia sp. Uapishka_3]